MNKHTPGPLKLQFEPSDRIGGNKYQIVYSDGDLRSHVATLYEGALCPEHGDLHANASLFAAAPDMLGALEATIERLRYVPQDEWTDTERLLWRDGTAAIAKAKGGAGHDTKS